MDTAVEDAATSDAGTDMSLLDALRRNFLIVVDDKMFSKRAFSRHTRAEVIDQKVAKKTGSSLVISLTEASTEWQSRLLPAVHSNQIYRLHPLHKDEDTYVAVGVFHNTLLEEKRQELQAILRGLGAKRIEWSRRREWNLEYELPASGEPEYEPDKHTYVHYESSWQTMVEDRLRGWCAQFTMVFSYENDYQVNDEIINKINKKLGGHRRVGSKEKMLEQVAPSQVRAANFTPVRDTVHVTFFSREEHRRFTQQQLQTRWAEEHVEAWLRQTNMYNWFQREEGTLNMTARELFALDIATLVDQYRLSKEQCDSFISKRNQLGEPGTLDGLAEIDRAADEIRQHRLHPKKQKLKKPGSVSSMKSQQAGADGDTGTLDAAVEEKDDDITTEALDEAEGSYEIAVLGAGGVGKSSIVNRWLGKSFNPSEAATPGVVYLEHPMGRATLNIWDTAGQASHRSQAILCARRADVCVIVYDITNTATLETARELLADVQRTGTKSHCAICLAGNKSDRESQRQVSMVDGLRLAQEFGVSLFFETSAAHDSNLSILLCNAILAASRRNPPDTRNSIMLTEENVTPRSTTSKRSKCCS